VFIATQSGLDWIEFEQCFTSTPTQYRLYGRRFLQVKRPNQQYQSTEGTNSTQTNQTYRSLTLLTTVIRLLRLLLVDVAASYRAMLYRARYCYGKSSVCLSVSLSMTLRYRDYVGWKSSKVIPRLVSLRCSLSADPNITDLLRRERRKILRQMDPPPVKLSVADIRRQIAAEWSDDHIGSLQATIS